ncbi:sugar phosphate nucleotidyltransferase [Paenibacillus xerothermodurans]|uniref:Nucleotidyl transferase n=1 Tax=Paenibacillus xerothermodurans TaxID=1977292 RepID=A0A2W1NPJ8_PAEXE|nr:sugar phosphate nucleotidyltransferase [Paenibacillus xerothermodurans]PZE21415.1 nucleotidyl transferase [Paenibacillus xerothermodurans]
MKGLILCAGKGTRLYPFTYSYPKALVPVANVPVLQTCIEKLAELDVREVGIVIQPSQEPIIKAHIGGGERWGLEISYIHQHHPAGISDAVRQAERFINGSPFVLLLGDNLIAESLLPLKQLFQAEDSAAALVLKRIDNPAGYGIAEVAGRRVVGLEEKPLHPKSNLAAMGAYVFGPAIFQAISAIAPSARGEYEITDAIQWLIDRNHAVSYHVTDKPPFDVGTAERWLEANRWMLDDRKGDVIHNTAALENCRIISPVNIARGTVLQNCVIGPYVTIGADAFIEDCRIENSIILDEVYLKHISHAVKETILGYRSVLVGGM